MISYYNFIQVINTFFLIIFLNPILNQYAFAADCPSCQKQVSDYKTGVGEIENAFKMLKTNEDELAKISASEVSKRVKFGSNVFMWKAKLETLENNNTVLATAINADCGACGIQKLVIPQEKTGSTKP